MVGSKMIDRAMGMVMKELARAAVTWKQAYFAVVISESLQLPCKGTKGDGGAKRGVTPSTVPNPTAP